MQLVLPWGNACTVPTCKSCCGPTDTDDQVVEIRCTRCLAQLAALQLLPTAQPELMGVQAAKAKSIVRQLTESKLAGQDYSSDLLLILQEVTSPEIQDLLCHIQYALASPC